MTRVKRVFSSHQETCHVWASRELDHGRSSDGRIFFEGETIYSYGHHFPMAKMIPESDTVLINANKYSVSTSKHQSEMRSAIPYNMKRIEVTEVEHNEFEHNQQKNIAWFLENIKECKKRFEKARENSWHIYNEQRSFVNNMLEYCRLFDVNIPKYWEYLINENEAIEKYNKYQKAKEERERKKHKEYYELLELVKPEIEKLKNIWVKGISDRKTIEVGFDNKGNIIIDGENIKKGKRYFSFGETLLRINPNDHKTVETSQGAKVPVTHAKRLFQKYMYGERMENVKIGYYTVNGLDDNGITIGCHKISHEEIERFAEDQGWMQEFKENDKEAENYLNDIKNDLEL